MNLARYRKTIVALLTAVAATAVAAANGRVTSEEATVVAGAWLTVFGVFSVPNSPPPNQVETYLEGRLRTDPGEGRGPDDQAAARFLAEHGMVPRFAGDELVIEAGSEALLPPWPPVTICAVCQTPVARHGEAGWRHEVGLAERGGCTTPWPEG